MKPRTKHIVFGGVFGAAGAAIMIALFGRRMAIFQPTLPALREHRHHDENERGEYGKKHHRHHHEER